jgi:hypothetical protein
MHMYMCSNICNLLCFNSFFLLAVCKNALIIFSKRSRGLYFFFSGENNLCLRELPGRDDRRESSANSFFADSKRPRRMASL